MALRTNGPSRNRTIPYNLSAVLNKDQFSEKVVEAAARSGYATAPHLVPSTTRALGAADWRWFTLCARLLSLTRQANSALDSARLADHIQVETDTYRRRLTLSCRDQWLRLQRERVLGRGHITVERSYCLPAYPPEPTDLAALEELVFELVWASGHATLV